MMSPLRAIRRRVWQRFCPHCWHPYTNANGYRFRICCHCDKHEERP